MPGGGPVTACWALPETQPAVPDTTVVASATATRVLAYRLIRPRFPLRPSRIPHAERRDQGEGRKRTAAGASHRGANRAVIPG